MTSLLRISHLGVELPTEAGYRSVLRDVSIEIGAGEALGLVGESGSGKSMTARSIARLLPAGARVTGEIRYQGRDVMLCEGQELRAVRSKIAMVFQDPRAHINPLRTVGDFLAEAMRVTKGVGRAEAARRSIKVLDDVGVPDASRRLRQFPHELSGGLLQRVMIAAALLSEPEMILADEPTTALDVTTQADVMAILDQLRRDLGLALLFITHDLELAAAVCDRTAVMYAGQLMEVQTSGQLHDAPLHPYTAALSASRPSLVEVSRRLPVTPGRPLSAFEVADGCPFAPRCAYADEVCTTLTPDLRAFGDGRVACHHAESLVLVGGGRHG